MSTNPGAPSPVFPPPPALTWARQLLEAYAGGQRDFPGAYLSGIELAGADLSGIRLPGADLDGAHIRDTKLANARLDGARLNGAQVQDSDLSNATLTDASLKDAELHGTVLRGALLARADLTGAEGLTASTFGRANLTGARLPATFAWSQLEGATERSKTAAYVTLLAACAYAVVTVAGMSDVQLLTNAGSVTLPVMDTSVSAAGFGWAAPLVLLLVLVNFHQALVALSEDMGQLPAVFPDGSALGKRLHGWLGADVVSTMLQPSAAAGLPAHLRPIAAALWGAGPVTLLVLWARYLSRRDWTCSALQALAVAAACALAVHSFRTVWLAGGFVGRRSPRRSSYRALVVVAAAFGALSLGAFFGELPTKQNRTAWRSWTPRLLGVAGIDPFANLARQDVSMRPDSWDSATDSVGKVRGASLGRRDLRYADGFSAFLVKADLTDADLRGAILSGADMRGANLRRTKLDQAVLVTSVLTDASLRRARLVRSVLTDADLTRAVLVRANACRADLDGARLENADLSGIDFSWADLSQATLSDPEQWAKIGKATGAFVHGAAPPEFVLWARKNGASTLTDRDLWRRFRERAQCEPIS